MNVPKIRYDNFTKEWEKVKLSSQASFLQGLTYTPNDVSNDGTIVLRSSNIQNSMVDYNDIVRVNIIIPEKLKIKGNDILMCVRNGSKSLVGKTAWLSKNEEKCTWGAFMNIIRPKEKNKFVYYYLNSKYFYNHVWKDLGTATVNQITKQTLESCYLNIPSIEEQEKIANTLSLLDQKIKLQTKKIEDLKLFKLYSENKLLNSNGSIYWKKIKLNDILIEGNKEPVKNTNDFKKITIKLNLNGLEFNESKRETSDRRPFYIREENEIIIGKQNYFNGSIAIVTKKFSGCICSNAIMSFKVKEGYNLKYIYLYLSQKRYMKEREFLANGTGQKELSEKEFLKFTIKVPEDSVVKKITNIIEKINKKINFENNKLNKLIELKKGLMQNMFV